MNYIDIFKQICNIPRPSHHEEAVADFLCRFAEERNLDYERDEHNCVVIRKPASPGYEDRDPIVLLNHTDMVCVADEGYNVPGSVTPIIYNENDETWMRADHTSLGADNGIGLSMALALLDDDTLQHPTLEVLCTACEEDDMSGAANLAPDFIKGRCVLNLDSENYNEITVGSAGAHIQLATLPVQRTGMPQGYAAYEVNVAGGKGGHSGVDIDKTRGNAIKILANLLLVAIRQMNIKLYLVSFEGGQAYSAIPTEARAKIVLPHEDAETFDVLVSQCNDALTAQYSATDPALHVECEPSVWHSSVMNEESTHVFLAAINGIPTGVTEWGDGETGKQVVTSNNIGVVKMLHSVKHPSFVISTHTRSNDYEKMHRLSADISRIFTLVGAKVETVLDAKPWSEDISNPFIRKTMEVFQDVVGFRPKPVSMHFVLEAAYLVDKFPGIHIASIGPLIIGAHSTKERVNLTTAENIWRITKSIIESSKHF
ncbi:MAG: beta-Ala-His dipeptidase [Prevotella sp.]|nr:beta-Ala-His dipeptidase [Prevotella sp.]MBR6192012.1 beta-Ala-His dipeptidase [Prevotella sp.]